MIFVYDDGIHAKSCLLQTLQSSGQEWQLVSAIEIANGILDTAKILIMPGGADLYFCEKLNGTGNQAIRQFVENGGTYIGICAGAYYACRRIFWAEDEGEAAICGERELGFYKGSARGPIYPFIKDINHVQAWCKTVTIDWNGQHINVHYEGGPVFEPDDDCDAIVLARYTDLPNQPAAILQCNVGKGTVILSSPHIEIYRNNRHMNLYRHNNDFYENHLQDAVKLCKKSPLANLLEKVIDTHHGHNP